MAVIVSAIELAYIAVMNFSAQIFFCEFMFCMRLRRRPMFWARVLAIVPVVLGPILYQWSTGNVFYMLPIFFGEMVLLYLHPAGDHILTSALVLLR